MSPRDHLSPLAALVVLITVVVQVAAIWVVTDPLQAVDAPAPVQTAENDASSAVPVLVLVVVEIVVVWALFALYRRLPAWLQRWVKRGSLVLVVSYALLYAVAIMPELFAIYAIVTIAYIGGYRWLAYDIGGLTIGVIIAATLGGYLGPVPVIVLLVALIAYDWLAVVETRVMDRVARLLADMGLPVMLVIPKSLDFDLQAFLRSIGDDGIDLKHNGVHLAIGIGDFALPAALTVAAFRYFGASVAAAVLAGTVVGTVALLAKKTDGEAMPGLPWLAGGAVLGFDAAIIVMEFALWI